MKVIIKKPQIFYKHFTNIYSNDEKTADSGTVLCTAESRSFGSFLPSAFEVFEGGVCVCACIAKDGRQACMHFSAEKRCMIPCNSF